MWAIIGGECNSSSLVVELLPSKVHKATKGELRDRYLGCVVPVPRHRININTLMSYVKRVYLLNRQRR